LRIKTDDMEHRLCTFFKKKSMPSCWVVFCPLFAEVLLKCITFVHDSGFEMKSLFGTKALLQNIMGSFY